MKIATHTKARSFEISRIKNLAKPRNPREVTRICDQSKSRARCHHSSKLGLTLKYLNSDQLLLSQSSELGYSKSTQPNVEKEPNELMTKIITSIKPKGMKQYLCCFLQYQILKAQKRGFLNSTQKN